MRKLHGFTLVEMAVVLVIIGLIMAAALGVGNAQMQSARISATKQKQEGIRLALINFISRNNRLPCPAKADLLPADAGYGVEAPTPGTCTGTGVAPLVSGIVPFVTLGITDENASDGYYNRFTYLIALAATADSQNIAGLKGVITIHNLIPVSPGPLPGGNQTNLCFVGTYNPCLAVVAIISHGVNGLGAYTAQGTQIPGAVGAEAENANADKAVVIKEFASNNADPFDDIVLPLNS